MSAAILRSRAGAALFIALVAAAAGWAAIGTYGAIAAAAVGLLVVAAIAARVVSRPIMATVILWIGLIAPNAVTQARTQANVQSAPINSLAIVQVAVPLMCLGLAWILVRPQLTAFSRRETLLITYLAVALASGIWAVSAQTTELKALQLIISYALVLLAVRTWRGAELVTSLVGAVQILIISTLVGLAAVPGPALAPIDQYYPVARLKGLFPAVGPDILGFLASVGLVAAILRVGPRWTQGAVARVGLLAADIGVLALSRSRTALLLVVVGVLIGLLSQRDKRARTMVMSVPAILLASLAFSAASGQAVTFLQRGQSQGAFTSLTGRTQIWSAALSFSEQNLVVGHGFYSGHRLGAFAALFPFQTTNIDNMWLETLLDLGLLGLVPLTAFVVAGGVRIFRLPVRSSSPELMLRCLFGIGLVSSIFNPSLQEPNYTMVVFGLVLLARSDAGTVQYSDVGWVRAGRRRRSLSRQRAIMGLSVETD